MRRDILVSMTLALPPASVWTRLVDLGGWEQWHPLLSIQAGELETGRRLRACLHLPGRSARAVRPEILRVLPARELSWLMRLWSPGLLDCEFRLLLELPDHGEPTHTVLIQRARFSGILLPMLWPRLRSALTDGFDQSNRNLKALML